MDSIMTCTSEELALLVTINGYPGVANSIVRLLLGEKAKKNGRPLWIPLSIN
ncbi:hypothetical protein [Neobacillus niacini]|uniref:hypothetical protein n=1 Tax=Neobacillus niacini TaxID=86668 RepID=UPI00285AB555|nr:hypothetical protein [Neobacillus niacini]MDR6999331.1 hypothetical protein [Neobacillus niacini]